MSTRHDDDPEALLEQAYKQHRARIFAALVRIFGTSHLDLAEDVLQDTFGKALARWHEQGIPDNPAGWLMTAAKNQAIDVIRAQRTRTRFSDDLSLQLESDWTLSYTVEQEFAETKIHDHQLRMIFMCTSAELAPENRLPLILRALCGFSIPAISRALLVPEATVKKRLLRTREKLEGHAFAFPSEAELPNAMDTVHTVLYLLFNEGFHSSDATAVMKFELCREAIHLTSLIVAETAIVNRDTLGLLALMHFHAARKESRVDSQGHNVPIDLQDRSLWDHEAIRQARALLRVAEAVVPGASGRFFIEARIAEQHCIAERFEDTDWSAIVALSDQLVLATNSPLARLNHAVALGYQGQVEEALSEALALSTEPLLQKSHVTWATLAHLSAMLGDPDAARRHAERAKALGGTPHEQRVMFDQITRLLERVRTPARAKP